MLRGEPGIGKSSLLRYAHSQADGFTVLCGRGVESEFELPYAALAEVVRPVQGRIDELPRSQADALGAALLVQGTSREPASRFASAAGLLGLLALEAERCPLLVLVDDAHWLDAASAEALGFVSRRLHAEGIVMLFAARHGMVGVNVEYRLAPQFAW